MTTSHFVLIENPQTDYFVGIDELTYLSVAYDLSNLKYSEIWNIAFTDFKYSEAPLFNAWLGTLQKLIDLDRFYSYLFQKLNTSFFGSLIPGIVYLLCNSITSNKYAYRAAVVYGLFSFTLFYSSVLLRDIHIALFYSISFYIIICKRYNLKNYVVLVLMGLIVYYLRVENGLFFIVFIVLWLYESGSNKKILIGFTTLITIASILILIGGIETIYNTALSTIERYSVRSIRLADETSLGAELRLLPIPLNFIGLTAFGQISPFPFWVVFRDDIDLYKNLFFILEVIAAIFWFNVWIKILILKSKKTLEFFRKYRSISIVVILYLVLVSIGLPDVRRLIVVYPIIYMAYVYISEKYLTINELLYSINTYVLLIVVYLFLKF